LGNCTINKSRLHLKPTPLRLFSNSEAQQG
jgi:hypothetical protein